MELLNWKGKERRGAQQPSKQASEQGKAQNDSLKRHEEDQKRNNIASDLMIET